MSTRKEGSKLPHSTSKAAGASSSVRPGASSFKPGASSLRPASSLTSIGSASKVTGQSSFQPASMRPQYQTEAPQSMITTSSMVKGSRVSSSMKTKEPSAYKDPSTFKTSSSYKDPSALKSTSAFKEPSGYQTQTPGHGKYIHCPGCVCPGRNPPKQESTMPSRLDVASSMASRLDRGSYMAPLSTKSILQTPDDFKFASRQSQYPSLAPKDRKKQDDWAESQLKLIGACPEGYKNWIRRENPGGYQCERGGHGVTDELLAEGLGGIMSHKTKKWEESVGPYYPDPITGEHKRA